MASALENVILMPTLVHASEVLNSKTAHQCKLAGKRKAGSSLCNFPAITYLKLIHCVLCTLREREREREREGESLLICHLG